MSTKLLTPDELKQLDHLLQRLEESLEAVNKTTSYHENWNFYNHLEHVRGNVVQLRGDLYENPFDAEHWRAGACPYV